MKKFKFLAFLFVLFVSVFSLAGCGEDESKSYTLTLEANIDGVTLTGAGVHEEGSDVMLNAPKVTGYTFLGWYDGDTFIVDQNEHSYSMASKDKTLTAKYELTNYTVKYLEGTTEIVTSNRTTYKITDAEITLADAVKEHYTFKKWHARNSETEVNKINAESLVTLETDGSVQGNTISLYADFEVITHTVTLECDVPMQVASATIDGSTYGTFNEGDKIKFEYFSYYGYELDGFYDGDTKLELALVNDPSSTEDHTTGITGEYTVTKDVTITAKFNHTGYKIGYYLPSGENAETENSTKYVIGGDDLTLGDATLEGHTFLYWTTFQGVSDDPSSCTQVTVIDSETLSTLDAEGSINNYGNEILLYAIFEVEE